MPESSEQVQAMTEDLREREEDCPALIKIINNHAAMAADRVRVNSE